MSFTDFAFSFFLFFGFRLNDVWMFIVAHIRSSPGACLLLNFRELYKLHSWRICVLFFSHFPSIYWSHIKFVYFLGLFCHFICHDLDYYGTCLSNFILRWASLPLFRFLSHHDTVHNIKEIICTAFCSVDQSIVQVIASMFRQISRFVVSRFHHSHFWQTRWPMFNWMHVESRSGPPSAYVQFRYGS